MQTSNECFVCGNNNFTLMNGMFVCDECGIQSQTIREEQINYNENMTVAQDNVGEDIEITVGSQIINTKKLLSWECFNLILLGLTDEIIELGAKPNIKAIVLQLWVRYLQCINAAFISRQFKKLPKLNTSINNVVWKCIKALKNEECLNKVQIEQHIADHSTELGTVDILCTKTRATENQFDGEILYGVENLKQKILQAKTGINCTERKPSTYKRKPEISIGSSTSATTMSQKRNRITRKLRKMDNSTRDSVTRLSGVSDDVSLLQRSQKSGKIKIKLTKQIKKGLKSMPSKTSEISIGESSTLFERGKKCWSKLKYKDQKNILTMKKLISIIQFALMINNDDIFLSDIIRWVHEGHFHVNRIDLFLPENVVHGINICPMVNMSSRNRLNSELGMLLDHIEANQLPNIDFEKLVLRFCDELQLPSDFTQFVCKLVLISPPDIQFNKILPDIEIKVMSYILFAAKFVFTLDGNTENLSSNFAEKVNLSNQIDKQLFNWNEYVEYIECRNSVISEFNYVLHKNLYGNSIRKTQLFINDWNIRKSTIPITKSEQLSKGFRDSTECLLKSLPNVEKKSSYRGVPASAKPLSSTLKWIFEYYPMQLSDEATRILKQNFIQTDILYLIDKNRTQDLADECNIPIEVNCNIPLHYTHQETSYFDTCDTNKKKYNKSFIKVHLIEEPINKKEQNKTFYINLNEERPNTIFLGGLNYWCIHLNKRFVQRADISKLRTVLKQQLPYSFFWFMEQCYRILDCQLSDLYLELMHIEEVFSLFLKKYKSNDQMTECEDMLSNITI